MSPGREGTTRLNCHAQGTLDAVSLQAHDPRFRHLAPDLPPEPPVDYRACPKDPARGRNRRVSLRPSELANNGEGHFGQFDPSLLKQALSYLVGGDDGEGSKHLVFKLTQNDSISVPFRESTMPLDTRSLAGYAAATGKIVNIGDAYRIRRRPFALNRKFDEKLGYRTKSVLVVPMKNQKDEVIGVIQLINAKRRRASRLTLPERVSREVVPYSNRSQELAGALAGQAAVSLENNLLYRNIQELFEGFIRASVKAIEFRDPTTFGHSERVAKLTVGLAEAVDRSEVGPYRDIRFGRQDMQGNSLRRLAARYRESGGSGRGSHQGKEALSGADRPDPQAVPVHPQGDSIG